MMTQNKILAVNEIPVIQLIPVNAAYQSPLHRPGLLNLRHLHTYINQPLSTCLGDLSLLPQQFSAISGGAVRCVGIPTRGPGSQLVNAACFLIPNDDARGNTVTHGLSWFRPRGRTSSEGGVRGHCIILHPECL